MAASCREARALASCKNWYILHIFAFACSRRDQDAKAKICKIYHFLQLGLALGWSSRRRLGAIWKPPEAIRRQFRPVKTGIFCIVSLSRLQNEIKTRKRNMQNIPVFTSRNGPRVVAKAGQDGAKTTPKRRQVAKRPQDVQERRRKRVLANLQLGRLSLAVER